MANSIIKSISKKRILFATFLILLVLLGISMTELSIHLQEDNPEGGYKSSPNSNIFPDNIIREDINLDDKENTPISIGNKGSSGGSSGGNSGNSENGGSSGSESGITHPSSPDFVKVKNNNFYLNNNQFYFSGTNAFYLQQWQTYSLLNPSVSYVVDNAFESFTSNDVSAIRIWGFSDGYECAGISETDKRIIQKSPGVYNEDALKGLDNIIKKAKDNNIKLIITLTNYWTDYGGICQYGIWSGIVRPYNYDPSRDPLLIYENEKAKKYFKNYISMLLNRVNTETGISYKDEPAIMAWEVINEPEGNFNQKSDPLILRNWIREIAQHIKSIDKNHLVGTGEEGYDNIKTDYSSYLISNDNYNWMFSGEKGVSFTLNTQIPEIDFASIHLYPSYWFTQDADIIKAINIWISDHNKIAKNYKKPLIIGEYAYGTTQSYVENDPGKITIYSTLWKTIEDINIAGDLVWQLVDNGNCRENGDICYPGKDDLIYPLYKSHGLTMKSKRSENFNIDKIPPEIFVTGSPSNGDITQMIDFKINAFDYNGIKEIKLFIDNINVKTCLNSDLCIFNSLSLTIGTHSYYATALDNNNNLGYSNTKKLLITGQDNSSNSDIFVYQDSLKNPWIDVSWNIVKDLSNNEKAYDGSRSIKIINNPWGGLSFHYDNWNSGNYIDSNLYKGLEFAIYKNSSSVKIGVNLENDNRDSFPTINYENILNNQWQLIFIPINEINPGNKTISKINFLDLSGEQTTFYIDDIKFLEK